MVWRVSFVFMGWSMTGLGLLRREHRFRTLSIITVGTYVFGYLVVGVGLALLGAGVWSLVAASVASTASQAIWQYAVLRHPVRPVLRWQPYKAVCGYGSRLASAHLLDYGGGNLDTLTVSRLASTAVLGQYTRAYYLAFQPLGNYLAQALTNVLFSPLSRIQQDLGRLRRAYFSVLSLGNLMLFPICAGIAVAAHELVLVVLGPQWDLAAGLVPWFALAAGCHVASQLTQLLAEARAELNRSLVVQTAYIVALALLLVMVVPFRSRGVWVFAAAVAAAELLRYVCYLALARRVLGLPSARMWQAHVPALFAERRRGDGRRGHQVGARWPRSRPVRPGGRGRGRGARAGAVHSVLPTAGGPLRAVDAPCRGRCAGRGRRSSLAGGVARPRAAGPADSARGGIVTETLLLGLGLLVAAGLSVATLEVLITRADVAAALVLGSVVVQAFFVDRVPALVLPGGSRSMSPTWWFRWSWELRCCGSCGSVASTGISAGCCFSACCCSCRSSEAWRRSACSRASTPSANYLFFAGVAVYFATFPPAAWLSDRIGRIWLAVSIPMMVLVSLRWLAVFAGIDLGVPAEKFGADAAIRVIDGPFTFFLASAFVLTIPAWLRGEQQRWVRRISVPLLLFVLLLNRRTVWLALVIGVAVLVLRDRRLGRRALMLVTLGALTTAVAFVWLGGLQGEKRARGPIGLREPHLASGGLVGTGRRLVT